MEPPAHQAGQEQVQPSHQHLQPTMRLPRRHELVPLHPQPIPRRLLEAFGINVPDSDEEDHSQGHESSQQGQPVTRQETAARTGPEMHEEEEESGDEEEEDEEGWEDEEEEEDWDVDMTDPSWQKKAGEKYFAKRQEMAKGRDRAFKEVIWCLLVGSLPARCSTEQFLAGYPAKNLMTGFLQVDGLLTKRLQKLGVAPSTVIQDMENEELLALINALQAEADDRGLG